MYPLKKIKKRRSISRNLKAEEFYKIYQEYKSTGLHSALKMLFKISPKVQNNNKKNNVWRIKKIINHYNLGMEDLLVTKSGNLRKKGSGRPRKNKEPNWEIFNRDDLVEIAKRYY
ncbi:transposase [Mycoplasmopsis felis]|nr:transposase [Mycoplasmopsis felis]WQQ08742.1 transposase [Mycoplasmopsis felis]